MTLAHLVAVALVLYGLPVMAQDKQPKPEAVVEHPSTQINLQTPDFIAEQTAPPEPWLVVWNQPAVIASGRNLLVGDHLEQPRLNQSKTVPPLHLKAKTLDSDVTCLTLRTYVVARDSKDSDSTHPAGYSTCQPSAQYQLKTTVLRSDSPEK
jgi:hypothetical protein